ncbi:MAG: 50S ribosomal protein L10 [Dehalococcoidales bacterium]|nr:50S ribosomal protein L10 [Dehalococcoidales bacterium]
MRKQEKGKRIDKLQDELSKSTIGILTEYRGLKTPEINVLRKKMQDAGGDYRVVKNSLIVKAAERLTRTSITDMFKGPIAIAFGQGDVSQTAKVFTDHVRATKMTLPVKGGFMADKILTIAEISALASLPPKPVLIGKVIGGIKSPLYGIVGVLAGPMRGFQGVLQARIRQLEGNN